MSCAPASSPFPQQRRRFAYRKPVDSDAVRRRDPSKENVQVRSNTARIVGDPTWKLFVAEWDRKIARTIESMRMGEHTEDIKQEIYLYMCARDDKGLTGLERYDEQKGALSSYIYHLTILKTLNYKHKRERDRLLLLPLGTEIDFVAHSNKLDGHTDPLAQSERGDFYLQLERVAELFDDMAADADGFFDETGKFITRDPKTILQLLIQGHSRQDLARLLNCPIQEIDKLLETLRSNTQLRQLLNASTIAVDDRVDRKPDKLYLIEEKKLEPDPEHLQPTIMYPSFEFSSNAYMTSRECMDLTDKFIDQVKGILQAEAEFEESTRVARARIQQMRADLAASLAGTKPFQELSNIVKETIVRGDQLRSDVAAIDKIVLPPGDKALTRLKELFRAHPGRRFDREKLIEVAVGQTSVSEVTIGAYLNKLKKDGLLKKIDRETYEAVSA